MLGVFFTEVLADGGADVGPVACSHGGSGAGVESFEEEGFEVNCLGLVCLDQSFDVVAGGGMVAGSDLDLNVGDEMIRKFDRDLHSLLPLIQRVTEFIEGINYGTNFAGGEAAFVGFRINGYEQNDNVISPLVNNSVACTFPFLNVTVFDTNFKDGVGCSGYLITWTVSTSEFIK
jgi:hypothetical protein